MQTLSAWLKELGLERYSAVFAENGVDFETVHLLTESDLEKLGVLLGHRRKLLNAIADLDGIRTARPGAQAIQENSPAQESISVAAERRQLTVMFCDLAGSTALTQQLDPEQLRELMRAYQQACTIEKYRGHVAQYLGDGLMVYFGWPQAHEDDAERSVRVGLEVVNSIKGVTAPVRLQVRIGIATGTVVVGETGNGDASVPKLAVGETPNLAARLQALAGADEIVIGDATHRLLGASFEYQDLGDHGFKGILEPVRAWRVLGLGKAEGRFEAAHGATGLSPLVGREEELALLKRRWAQARAGEGQMVLLCGEPGIGKSRLTRVLREELAGEQYTVMRCQCSPYHQNSALYPVIEHLERAAGFSRDDTTEQKLDKLQALLAGSKAQIAEAVPLFAALLSLPTERYPPLELSPQKQKERTLETLAGQIEALALRQPLLMVFEDVHWIDPTSQEWLDLFVPRLQALPMLLAITHRPEYTPAWVGQPNVTSLMLNRLGRRQGIELVSRLTGGKALPPEVLEQILAHTDGVPLFIEELTKSVLESGLLREENDRHALLAPLPALAIPTTLRDSLIARLDRLGAVREIAQIGACIGREFTYALLAALSPLKGVRLAEALEQLNQAGLVFRRGTPPDALYTFKHALVQEAAYDSLLKSKRAHLHAQIVDVLQQDFPDQVENEPELLARHFTQAGLHERAVPYWILAGQRCLKVFAFTEAEAMADRARHHLGLLPRVDRIKLHVQLLKILVYPGVRLRKPEGLGAEIALLCREAQETGLVSELSEGMSLLSWLYHLTWADFPRARANVVQMMDLVQRLPVPQNIGAVVSSARCLAVMEVHMPKARAMFEELTAFGPAAVDTVFYQWGLGLVKRWEGDVDGARNALTKGAGLARDKGDPWAEFECMAALAAVELEAGRADVVSALCRDLEPLAAKIGEGGTERPLVDALAALATTARDEPEGARALDSAIRVLERMDAKYVLAYVLNSAAEIEARSDRWERAAEHARAALQAATTTGRAPEIAHAHVLLAGAAAAHGKTSEALEELSRLGQSDPEQLSARARAAFEHLMATYVDPSVTRR